MIYKYLILLYYKYKYTFDSFHNFRNNLVVSQQQKLDRIEQYSKQIPITTTKNQYNNSSFKDLWENERKKIQTNNIRQ